MSRKSRQLVLSRGLAQTALQPTEQGPGLKCCGGLGAAALGPEGAPIEQQGDTG